MRPEIMLGPQVVQKVVGYPQVVPQVVPWTPQDFFQVAHRLRTGCAQVAHRLRTGCAQPVMFVWFSNYLSPNLFETSYPSEQASEQDGRASEQDGRVVGGLGTHGHASMPLRGSHYSISVMIVMTNY